MFDQPYKKVCLFGMATLMVAIATACEPTGESVPLPTKQGTIMLDALRVGIPESSIEGAKITFVPDKNMLLKDKTQYISRPNDELGGQYIVQCRDGIVFEIQCFYRTKPITRDEALKKLKTLLPSDCPPQSKLVQDSLTERYSFGNDFAGEITYTDNSHQNVSEVGGILTLVTSAPSS